MSPRRLQDSLKEICAPTHVGHYYEVISLPKVLTMTFNWRKDRRSNEIADLETLFHQDEGKYEEALKVLESTASYSCFEGDLS